MNKQLMRERLAAVKEGVMEGARETPREFFAPLIELGRRIGTAGDGRSASPPSHFTLSSEASTALVEVAEKLAVTPQAAVEMAVNEFSARHGSRAKEAKT